MSSLISPSRCLRVNHLQLQKLEPHAHRHMHRLVRASAGDILIRAICIERPLNSSGLHKRGLHSSFRVQFSEPKDRSTEASSSRTRTECPSPSSSTPSSRPNFRSNYDPESRSFRSNYNSRPKYNSQSSSNSSSNFDSKPNHTSNSDYKSRKSSSPSSPPAPQTPKWYSANKPVTHSHWQLRGKSKKNKETISADPFTQSLSPRPNYPPSKPSSVDLDSLAAPEKASERHVVGTKMRNTRLIVKLLGENLLAAHYTSRPSVPSSFPAAAAAPGPATASSRPKSNPSGTSAQLDSELDLAANSPLWSDVDSRYGVGGVGDSAGSGVSPRLALERELKPNANPHRGSG
ncbi:hypothetical protein CPB84DRAFT_1212637 [Gymnopilus junonius]|uniref:Uncharacterized protein n=1 Tax=Gymnopilus junonius TaxID=109634 RepID=A0A9P5TL79_GYMJU|nr:hypothetical protein CPB84DRAFT_1212637 [Gymnopilus junonius]